MMVLSDTTGQGLPRDLSATPSERAAFGHMARKRIPRSELGKWNEQARDHDPLETILAQNAIRLADLLPIRHGRMGSSPWNFYRGAAAVMARDLASRPQSGLEVQLCGDAHVLNFGLWATPERNLAFDLRDFDETYPGPFEWDLLRLAASLVVLAGEHGVRTSRARAAVVAATEAYRKRMRLYRRMPEIDVWYDSTRVDNLLGYFEPADRGRVSVYIEKQGKRRTHRGAFAKLTTTIHGRPRITQDPPIRITVEDHEQSEIVDELVASYRSSLRSDRRLLFDRFTEVDMVRQVVGVGSVGMRVYLVLFEGRTGADPLFLQFKQAGPSVYDRDPRRGEQAHQGERVITGKRRIQSATDILVGWGSLRGMDFYVRQFRDMKIIPSTELLAPRLEEAATACGETLARAHARTGDPIGIAAYMGQNDTFADAVVTFALSYAEQNRRDHAQLAAAIAAGRLDAYTV